MSKRDSKDSRLRSKVVDEVRDLHPLLNALLPKLPFIREVEYRHGTNEMGADFVLQKEDQTLGNIDYVGVIAKVGKILQDLSGVEAQIRECELSRLYFNGAVTISLREIWIITTDTITKNAEAKINHNFANRKIHFIDGARLETLIEKHLPEFWVDLPVAVNLYLRRIKERNIEQDKAMSLIEVPSGFYIPQDVFPVENLKKQFAAPRRSADRIDLAELPSKNRTIVVEGSIGSGKSKMLRRLVELHSEPDAFRDSRRLPVITSYADLVKKHHGSCGALVEAEVEPEVLKAVKHQGEFLILVDGFDEVALAPEERGPALKQLFDQVAGSNLSLIVTTRHVAGLDDAVNATASVLRCELRDLSFERTLTFLRTLCLNLNQRDRLIEDLKKSQLYKELPSSPIAAILLAKLINENAQELPSNLTELYQKYLEMILGRWDMDKGLQSQKEYQAMDNILMNLSIEVMKNERQTVSTQEFEYMVREYLQERNLDIAPSDLTSRMMYRCEALAVDRWSGSVAFRHRSFAEFFFARSMHRDGSATIGQDIFVPYWMNSYFFYVGIKRDAPQELEQILDLKPESELGEWMRLANVANFFLAAYATPYKVIDRGVLVAALETADFYLRLVREGANSPFAAWPRLYVLMLLQVMFRTNFSYGFFSKALEAAGLEIAQMEDGERKAYALFFVRGAYIEVGEARSFDFLLKTLGDQVPTDMAVALQQFGKMAGEKTDLLKKLGKRTRRMVESSPAASSFVRALTTRPVGPKRVEKLNTDKLD